MVIWDRFPLCCFFRRRCALQRNTHIVEMKGEKNKLNVYYVRVKMDFLLWNKHKRYVFAINNSQMPHLQFLFVPQFFLHFTLYVIIFVLRFTKFLHDMICDDQVGVLETEKTFGITLKKTHHNLTQNLLKFSQIPHPPFYDPSLPIYYTLTQSTFPICYIKTCTHTNHKSNLNSIFQ